jgi:apolipoprotein N-acyltransferase
MRNEERPRLKIKLEPFDKIIETIGIFSVAFMISLPFIYTYSSNETNINWSLWILPLIGLTIYVGIAFLKKYPHLFNYPNRITHENAQFQYKTAIRLLRILNTLSGFMFAAMTYAMTPDDLDLGKITKVGIPLIATLLIAISSSYYIYKLMLRK